MKDVIGEAVLIFFIFVALTVVTFVALLYPYKYKLKHWEEGGATLATQSFSGNNIKKKTELSLEEQLEALSEEDLDEITEPGYEPSPEEVKDFLEKREKYGIEEPSDTLRETCTEAYLEGKIVEGGNDCLPIYNELEKAGEVFGSNKN